MVDYQKSELWTSMGEYIPPWSLRIMQRIMKGWEHLTSHKNSLFIGSIHRDFEYHCIHSLILYKSLKKANCIFAYFFYTLRMNTIHIDTENIRVQESCYLFDTGSIERVKIDIGEWIEVKYCFVKDASTLPTQNYRHICIGKGTNFTWTGLMIDTVHLEIITEICGDDASSTLDLLALATDTTSISIEGVVRVASPYRHILTRVDQTNILIGTGARVRGVPRLEIATDDIEGGHSCRIHRLGGEALFYLTSRGLTEENAETLLLNSEIVRHLRTIQEEQRDQVYSNVQMRLKK